MEVTKVTYFQITENHLILERSLEISGPKNNHLVPILLVSLHILENSSRWPRLWFAGRVKGCGVDTDNLWVNRPEFLSFWISIQSAWKSTNANSDHSAEKEYTSTKELIDYETEREGKKSYWP